MTLNAMLTTAGVGSVVASRTAVSGRAACAVGSFLCEAQCLCVAVRHSFCESPSRCSRVLPIQASRGGTLGHATFAQASNAMARVIARRTDVGLLAGPWHSIPWRASGFLTIMQACSSSIGWGKLQNCPPLFASRAVGGRDTMSTGQNTRKA